MPQSFSTLFLLALMGAEPMAAFTIGDTPVVAAVREVFQEDSIAVRTKGDDWPRMLGSRFDSQSKETGILFDWPKKGLRIVWTADTGVGYGNGVAAGGRWFQFDRFGNNERLECRNAETGVLIWQWQAPVEYRDAYGYNNGPRCSPVVDADRVYVYGVAGTLACLSVVDGKEIWRRDVNEEYNVAPNFFGVGASPLVHGDKLLVMVGGSLQANNLGLRGGNMDNAKADGTAMVAFNKLTGKEVYRVGRYLASYSAPVVQSLNGRDTCLAFVREGLLAFDPQDGSGEGFFPWRAKSMESVNAASPVVWRDRILISECYELGTVVLNRESTGQFQLAYRDPLGRKEQLIRAHWATPLLSGDRLIASCGRNGPDTDLRSLTLRPGIPSEGAAKNTGEPVSLSLNWQNRNRDRMTGLLVDDHAVMLGEFGALQLVPLNTKQFTVLSEMNLDQILDPRDGKPLVEAPSWAPPVLSRGLLYVRGASKVVCLELIPE